MSSSIFGAEQRISEPLSALAVLTGRHREKNTRDPVLVKSQRVNEINESTIDRENRLLIGKIKYKDCGRFLAILLQ